MTLALRPNGKRTNGKKAPSSGPAVKRKRKQKPGDDLRPLDSTLTGQR